MNTNILYINPYEIQSNKEANLLLPYSIGIEIECSKNPEKENSIYDSIETIPYLMEYNTPNDTENKFRIPNGKEGLICLYEISNYCKENLLLNDASGIHYHVDCTDWMDDVKKHEISENISDYILNELDSWNYKGKFNKRNIAWNKKLNWVNIRSNTFKTIEYRIGEMTFDYSTLLKKIVHVSMLTQIFKSHFTNDKNLIISKIINKYNLNFVDTDRKIISDLNENTIKNTLKNRYVVL